jgi:hypothetical protein
MSVRKLMGADSPLWASLIGFKQMPVNHGHEYLGRTGQISKDLKNSTCFPYDVVM